MSGAMPSASRISWLPASNRLAASLPSLTGTTGDALAAKPLEGLVERRRHPLDQDDRAARRRRRRGSAPDIRSAFARRAEAARASRRHHLPDRHRSGRRAPWHTPRRWNFPLKPTAIGQAGTQISSLRTVPICRFPLETKVVNSPVMSTSPHRAQQRSALWPRGIGPDRKAKRFIRTAIRSDELGRNPRRAWRRQRGRRGRCSAGRCRSWRCCGPATPPGRPDGRWPTSR